MRGLIWTAVLLFGAVPIVHSAQNFIVSSNVKSGTNVAEISIQLACIAEYVEHYPDVATDRLRIQLEPTQICNGVSPTVAQSRQHFRPPNADEIKLVDIIYDGESSANASLFLNFSEAVNFEVVKSAASNDIVVRVYLNKAISEPTITPTPGESHVTILTDEKPLEFVINLSSSRRPHAPSDMDIPNLAPGLSVFETEIELAGVTWHRLRIGQFNSSEDAQTTLTSLEKQYPVAWIDSAENDGQSAPTTADPADFVSDGAFASIGLDKIDALMADARRAMAAKDISRAVQIYTKVLRVPGHDRHAQAQEYLALAREKNGQIAHAKAEYQRYLALYPNGEGAQRVNQRLSTLLAIDRKADTLGSPGATSTNAAVTRSARDDWRIQTFFSQYYRRDVNQPNDVDEIVSQSALYSDINLDVRRRGSRFDFSSRLSAGYRNDFLSETQGSGNQARVSYAYADLAGVETGIRGRIGRQSRNSGGVLGRFDGLDLGYQLNDKIHFNAVAGIPVNSASDDVDSERSFQGLSIKYGPFIDNLEVGAYVISQRIEGIEDRTAVGAEFRYFGEDKNFWGLIDYDTSFAELGSAFLQGSWRITPRLSVHGSVNRRHSPYLSTRNGMIGQSVQSFSELLTFFSEDEIRQFSLDRSPLSESFTVGLSHSFSPKLQINIDANQTSIDASPSSGGIAATPESTYRYFSTTLVASSLIKEGDVSIIALRLSDSESAKITSLNLDSRFPLTRSWRISPRLRVDQRKINSDFSTEWVYTPGIRILFRKSQKYRIDLEAGKRFSQLDSAIVDFDRESYFFNLGYQVFF
ncbi:MAG: hypothetical protein HOM16_01395 [Woeseia sp.]|nr:hypothetical protein [Woeseia sp.]